MNLKKTLEPDAIRLKLNAGTKREVIEELLDVLVAAGKIPNREGALAALLAREAKMSTGMQHGLALPHAKTDAADRLVAALGIKPEGIDFQSLDGEPARIFLLTLSPLNRTGPHIQFLAEFGRFVSAPGVRERLLKAASVAEVLAILGPLGT